MTYRAVYSKGSRRVTVVLLLDTVLQFEETRVIYFFSIKFSGLQIRSGLEPSIQICVIRCEITDLLARV